MSAGVIASTGLAILVLVVPAALVLWSRSATMFSGKGLALYDGPSVLDVDPEDEGVPEVGLSDEEEAAWQELTEISWNMPHRAS